MPIPLPNLDDRRWADLVDEGRAQIPRYAPDWTDHNAHDPGITLIDLFAWLTEMTAYRLNRVPVEHRRKFVELLGFTPLGPTPARAVLSYSPPGGTASFPIATGVEFEATAPDMRTLPYRTLHDVTVSAAALQAVRVDAGSGAIVDRTPDFVDGFPIELLGPNPQPGAAFYLGFDALPGGVPLSLGFGFGGPGSDAAERRCILAEAAAQAKACRPVRTRLHCTPAPPEPEMLLPPHHSVRIEWEVFTAAGWEPAVPSRDDTRSLTLDGIVELRAPAGVAAQDLGGVGPTLFYIRCRLVEGAFDAVPVLLDVAVNAVLVEQAVPATQRFVIRAGVTPTPPAASTRFTMTIDDRATIQSLDFTPTTGPLARVLRYEPATATTTGEIILDLEFVGVSSGLPDQQFALRNTTVARGELELHTLRGSDWRSWILRSDFAASGRTDNDFALDPSTGMIRFGTGERGRVPEAGSLIFASYRSTADAAGNLAAGLIDRPRQSPINDLLLPPAIRDMLETITTNRAASVDGAPEESLNQTTGAAVEILHAHQRLLDLVAETKSATLDQIEPARVRALVAPQRAVNLVDIERIALSVPGTRVARARAWSSLHPSYPCLEAPGVVTVVIVPEAPPGMPAPSPGLLKAVWRYLDRRRTLTTMLHVIGPQYVKVTASGTVAVRSGASVARVKERISVALETFLNPLTGGPDSFGWPFGRSVFRAEILQLIDGVPGVDHVLRLSLRADTGPQQCGDIALCPMALVYSGSPSIEVL
jgi:predicted phage baseplate assembly protein